MPLEEKKAWEFWKHPKTLKPSQWLLEVMLQPEQADQRPIFLIHHPDLLGELKLNDKGIEKSGLRYYTYQELEPVRDEIHTQAARISENSRDAEGNIDDKRWTPLEKQTMKLENALTTYERLKNSLRPQNSDDFAGELADFQKALGPGMAAFKARDAGGSFDQSAFDRFVEPLHNYLVVAKMALPLTVPPLHPPGAPE